MTQSDWLSRRAPPPPEELARAIREAMKAANITTETPTAAELLTAARSLLSQVLEAECATRASALHLLTADALVTYSLELANDDPNLLSGFTNDAVTALAETSPGRDREAR